VVEITQLEKNILIVTTREVRIYSHSSGVLLKVLKGVFGSNSIVLAHLIELRRILLLMNDEGLLKIYSTKDFTQQVTYNLLAKPHYIAYDR
jgi:hypothetical protein